MKNWQIAIIFANFKNPFLKFVKILDFSEFSIFVEIHILDL